MALPSHQFSILNMRSFLEIKKKNNVIAKLKTKIINFLASILANPVFYLSKKCIFFDIPLLPLLDAKRP